MKKAVKIAAIVFLVTLLLDAGAFAFDRYRRNKAFTEMYDALTMEFDPACSTVEYGSDFSGEEAVANHTGTLELIHPIDTSSLGKQTLQYRLTDTDRFGKVATKDFSYEVTVEDTTGPVISLYENEISFSKGMDFDPFVYIDEIYDPVDGELTYSETLEKGTYTVENNVDTSTPGEYVIRFTGLDQQGNESVSECKVNILDKGKIFPYYIRINRAMNTVTVYTTDLEGNPRTPVKAMTCSTGRATPSGSYRTYYKQKWNGLFGDVYGQYATGIVGDILFHSVPYYSINKGDLEYEEYNKLGTTASMGCVRMCVRDVKWVYDYCSVGTTVEFYDDENDAGPLGKPEPIRIDVEDERRGWDPTDPDPDNPWNT